MNFYLYFFVFGCFPEMAEHQQQMEIDIVSEAWSIAEEAMGPGMSDAEVKKLLDCPCWPPAQLSPAQPGSFGLRFNTQ